MELPDELEGPGRRTESGQETGRRAGCIEQIAAEPVEQVDRRGRGRHQRITDGFISGDDGSQAPPGHFG